MAESYDGPALSAAMKAEVPVLRLCFDRADPAGHFTLSSEKKIGDCNKTSPTEDDVALILHTSGTTSRPKIVPL